MLLYCIIICQKYLTFFIFNSTERDKNECSFICFDEVLVPPEYKKNFFKTIALDNFKILIILSSIFVLICITFSFVVIVSRSSPFQDVALDRPDVCFQDLNPVDPQICDPPGRIGHSCLLLAHVETLIGDHSPEIS